MGRLFWIFLMGSMNHKGFIRERGRQEIQKKGCDEGSRGEEAMWCGIMNQGIRTASRGWKRLGGIIASRRNTGQPVVWMESSDTRAGRLTSRTVRWWIPVILSQHICGRLLRQQQETDTQVLSLASGPTSPRFPHVLAYPHLGSHLASVGTEISSPAWRSSPCKGIDSEGDKLIHKRKSACILAEGFLI